MDPGHFRVLAVEDNPGDVTLLEEYLQDSRHPWELTVAGRLDRALELLDRQDFDVVILDLGLPDSQDLDTLRRFLDTPPSVPVIVMTGHTDSDLAWEAVEEGAHDFLPKDELTPSLLERSLRYAVSRGRVEAELRSQKERFQTVLDLSVMGIYMIDREGRFTYANRQFAEIIGYEPEELVGRPVADFAVDDDRSRIRTAIRKRIEGEEESAQYTLRARRKDGQVVELEVHGRRIEFDEGPMILGALSDITEKKELERQLLHAQKIEAVGRLAGGVAHDFNNLLTVVSGNCVLLGQRLPEADPRHQFLREIREAADRATALTRQLLIFSRRDTIQPRAVDLHEIVGGLESILGRLLSEDIEITQDLDARVSCTEADPGRLEQMVMNLVLNAQDAMPGGGRIWMHTTDDPERAREWDPALVPEEPDGSWLYLRVADSGSGIDPDVLDQIYDPFFTTKGPQDGTGLGLSTVYGIVTDAGGQISAGNSPLGGAQFVIRLPRVVPAAADEDAEPEGFSEGHGERIFVLEDEDSVRSVVRRILERAGYEVVEVADPAEAPARFREAGRIDLLLSDIVMPGLHGPEIYQELREAHPDPDLRVLFMSGYSEETTAEKVGELQAAIISKPFRPAELLKAVARALDT